MNTRFKYRFRAVNEVTGESFEFTYTQAKNVIKYGLPQAHVPPGQYKIYEVWPTPSNKALLTGYKRV